MMHNFERKKIRTGNSSNVYRVYFPKKKEKNCQQLIDRCVFVN